nr:hypothetical protein [Tanacetum cinerariifolium]
MTTPITTSNNNNQMHNDSMAAGSENVHQQGRYAQWQSRFMRYIDTRPNSIWLRNAENQSGLRIIRIIKKRCCSDRKKGVPLSADQGDCLDDTDEEPDEQELKTHYLYMEKIQEKTKENAYASESALKKEMFEDLEYVQSLEKELDELQSDKSEFLKEYDLLMQECLTNNIMCAALCSITDIDEYSEMACKYLEKIQECKRPEIELSKQTENVSKEVYIGLFRKFWEN